MSMNNWKNRIIHKKNRGSQTTGKSKGIVATPLRKFMCRSNRSYKHKLYSVIMSVSINMGIFPRKTGGK